MQVIETAHEVGLPTTSTIMFGARGWPPQLGAPPGSCAIPSGQCTARRPIVQRVLNIALLSSAVTLEECLCALQARTGGITEFVPLPFVHMEAPIYLKGAVLQTSLCWCVPLDHDEERLLLWHQPAASALRAQVALQVLMSLH